MDQKKAYVKIALRLIGPILFVTILFKMDSTRIVDAVSHSNINFLILGILSSLVVPVLRATRWHLINLSQKIDIGLKSSIKHQFIGNCWASFTPGRMGMEAYRFSVVASQGYPVGKAIKSIVIDRMWDLLPILIFFTAGLFVYQDFPKNVLAIIALVIIVCFLFLSFAFNSKRPSKLGLFSVFVPKRIKAMHKGDELSFRLPSKIHSRCMFISLISLLINAVRLDFFLKALFIDVDFNYLIWSSTAVIISNYLPVSIMGFGTRDLTLILLLSRQYVIPEKSVYVSILIFISMIFIALIGALLNFPIAKKRKWS